MCMHQQSQSSPIIVWRNAPTAYVDVGGTRFAYRQLGPDTGVPVIFLNHLARELDRWDPRVVDGIAATRRVIVFDNRGIGGSEGKTPTSVEAMARDAIAFIQALGLTQVDLLGFSLGGFISQVIAQDAPQLIRKIILAGTGPAGGTGIARSHRSPSSTCSRVRSRARIRNPTSSSRRPRTAASRHANSWCGCKSAPNIATGRSRSPPSSRN